MRDENGLEKCVACGLCSVACPADAIYLEAAENDGTVQAGPRYASVYQIHKTRCIFCGYCEEACPGRRDLHGQGLRARGLQQGRLRVGQTRPARSGVGSADGRLITLRAITDRRVRASPQRQPPNPPAATMQIGASRRHPRRVRHRSGHHDAAPRRAAGLQVGDVASNDGEYFTPLAPLYWIKGNNEDFDVIAAAIAGARTGADAALPAQRRARIWSGRGASRARRHVRAELVQHAAVRAAAVEGAQDVGGVAEAGEEPRRQAAPFRARRGAGVQGAHEDRRVPHARSAAPVLSRGPPHRRRQDRC